MSRRALVGPLLVAFLSAIAGMAGCDGGGGDGDGDGDIDGDSDVDGDVDGDTDGDIDGDVDGDADGDVDGDADGDVDGDADGDADGGVMPLDPTTIPKFVEALVIPPAMPFEDQTAERTTYEIAVRQFDQQVLPSSLPQTTVWGYGRASDPLPSEGVSSTFNYPSFTVAARSDEVVRVTWINDLVDEAGAYLPHLLPVDQTLHWSNPAGPVDTMGTDVGPYLGPVPIVTHVHGAHVPSVSDGYPEAWYLPAAVDIPAGYATQGTHYGSVVAAPAGSAIFEYPNDQRAATLWYHDHSLGITRLNVYAGTAGFWIVGDDEEDALDLPGPRPQVGDADGTRYYDIPLAVQDRSFNDDGSWFYPSSREHFDGYAGPYRPDSEVHPTWNPEFFGNTMVVNGRTWPVLEVEPRLYRLRFLNGCGSRFLILRFDDDSLSFHQIGAEGGLLSGAPVELDQLLMAPAERADVIVDFSGLSVDDEVVLLNRGPDEPFKGPSPAVAQDPADPATTGQVMLFRVVAATGEGEAGTIPVSLPVIEPLATALPPRDVTLNEVMDEEADVPVAALLGTASDGPLTWSDEVTETMNVGDTEIWRIVNLTEDAHPIHLHLVMFQVLDRIPIDAEDYAEDQEAWLESGGTAPAVDDYFSGAPIARNPWEDGWKDTVIANPGEVTRVIANFDLEGLYAWHCHILEHEDNEMMRPFTVLP